MEAQALEQMGLTDRGLNEWLRGKTFLVDIGIVTAVSSDKTHVDVRHIVLPIVLGTQLDATETKNVELLFPGGGSMFSAQWDMAVGDTVLLLALKDYIDPVGGVAAPIPPVSGAHYTQDTMKAIPLDAFNTNSKFTIVATGNTLTIKGTDGQTIIMDVSAHKVTVNGNLEVDQ